MAKFYFHYSTPKGFAPVQELGGRTGLDSAFCREAKTACNVLLRMGKLSPSEYQSRENDNQNN